MSRLTPPVSKRDHMQGNPKAPVRSEEHTSELQSQSNLVCRLLLEKKKQKIPLTKYSTAMTTPTQITTPRSVRTERTFLSDRECMRTRIASTRFMDQTASRRPVDAA